jgi:post-segregation antitoxin (ccd killing protein)
MPKVNIYLPDDLADEARKAKLSLSPVCQRAIRKELHDVKIKESATSDIEKVAARLNTTIDEEEAELRDYGRKDGIEWARESATASELRIVVEEGQAPESAWESIRSGVEAYEGRPLIDWSDGTPYWRGFCAGAAEVWVAVLPLLSS